MFKFFCAVAIAGLLLTETAQARGRCCCSGGSAPAAASQPDATPQPPAPQAQRPSATRSFSYQPAAEAYVPAERARIDFSWGERSAGSKVLGNY